MSDQLDDLTAAVAESKTVVDSAIALIQGIAARIEAAGVDKTKLADLATSLRAESGALSQAVVDNTPAADPEAV